MSSLVERVNNCALAVNAPAVKRHSAGQSAATAPKREE